MKRLVALAAVLALAGCSLGGGDDKTLTEEQLAGAVLRERDLPEPFFAFDVGRERRADRPVGRRGGPERFGRRGGWVARFRRRGSTETAGPLVVESRAVAFASSGGAADELAALREELAAAGRMLAPPELGDEAIAWTTVEGAAPAAVAYFTVAWRRGTVVASVSLNGFAKRVTLADTVRLARAQDRRVQRLTS